MIYSEIFFFIWAQKFGDILVLLLLVSNQTADNNEQNFVMVL